MHAYAWELQTTGDDVVNMKRTTLLIAMIFTLSGCSLWERTKATVGAGPNQTSTVGFSAVISDAPNAQVIEIAFAYADASVAILTQTEEATWFTERVGYCSSYGSQLDIIRLELPMAYSAQLTSLPKNHKLAKSIFVFVREVGKVEITTIQDPWLQISEGKITLLEGPPGANGTRNALEAVEGAKTLC